MVGLVLAGCAKGGGEQPLAPVENPTAAQPPVGEAKGPLGLTRIVLPAGIAIEKPGLYYIETSTGQLEGWHPETDKVTVRPTADHRHLVVWEERYGWVVERPGQKAYPWDAATYTYLTGSGGRFLFAEKSSGKFVVRDEAMRQVGEFALPAGYSGARFSPDGKRLAVAGEGQPPRLVDVASGKASELGRAPTVKEGKLLGSFLVEGSGEVLLVRHEVQHMEPTGHAWSRNVIQHYTWAGKLVSEFAVDGYPAGLSKDGKLLAWQQDLGRLAPATVLTDLATGKPHLRVVSGYNARFTADGGLVMESSRGLKRLTPRGELTAAPVVANRENWVSLEAMPLPSPTSADRFGLGPVLLDEAGKVVHEARFAPYPGGGSWLIRSLGWAPSGKELAFAVHPPVGKGNLGGPFEGLAPKVQQPPFDDPYILVIQDPQNECLNLREGYSTASRVVRCLPSGTRLAAGDLGEASEKLNAPLWFEDGRTWLWVRTEQGEKGWVAFIEGSIHWAD